MSRPVDFPDIELAMIQLVQGSNEVFATPADEVARVATSTPPNLAAYLPFARVGLLDGRDDGVTDRAVVDVDVFAATREQARSLAEAFRTKINSRAAHRVNDVILDAVRTESRPRSLPVGVDGVWRFGATYNVAARR